MRLRAAAARLAQADGRTNRLVALAAVVAVALATVSIVVMGLEVNRKVGVVATANSDSSQWSLAQTEVELLALQTAILAADDGSDGGLADVRRRFDVFYSRVRTISRSPTYATLDELPDLHDAFVQIDAFLDRNVPLIDGPDEALREQLDALAEQVTDIRADVRLISLGGVDVLSTTADAERGSVARLLVFVSGLTFALFFALLLFVALLLAANRSASRRARDQARLRARHQAIVATSLDAVLVVSRDGRVLEFNGAAEDIFGYTRDEAVGAPMEELIIPDHLRAAHATGMKRHKETGERRVIGKGRIKIEARRKSGEVFPVELSIASAESSEGEVFVSFIRDISRRVATEQELMKARDEAVAGEKAKANLLAVMSHEMRTPLNGMLGTLELIDANYLPEKQKRYIDIIRASGRLLLHHVDDVLHVSRADAGKLDIASEPFSLPLLVTELVDSQRGVAEHRGNTISVRIGDGAKGWVAGDPIRIRQVLLNLVGNAIKFTRNGDIEVTAERSGGDILFRVSDTGIGIPETDRERIFDEFVTLDASYSRSAGGTGLGLAIARRLVEAMGGEIWVEDDGAEGSVFAFRLPLAEVETGASRAAGNVSAARTAAERPLRVLVVEDNSINRLVVCEMLEQGGHKVEEAHDGQEGVAMASRRTYDLVLMDISMPVLDGLEATRMIRAAEEPGRHLPIVALTAHALPDDVRRFREAGLDDVLIKPISRASLGDLIERFAGREKAGELPPGAHSERDGSMLVNEAQIEDMRQLLGAERTARQIGLFLKEMEDLLATVSLAATTGARAGEIRPAVHRLAGSAGVVGAIALRDRLQELETSLVMHPDIAKVDVTALEAAASATMLALRRVQERIVLS